VNKSLMYWVAQLPLFHRKPAPRTRAARPTVSLYTPVQVGGQRRDLSTLIDRENREFRFAKHPEVSKRVSLQMHREGRS
jgi:hypothetical protein